MASRNVHRVALRRSRLTTWPLLSGGGGGGGGSWSILSHGGCDRAGGGPALTLTGYVETGVDRTACGRSRAEFTALPGFCARRSTTIGGGKGGGGYARKKPTRIFPLTRYTTSLYAFSNNFKS